MLTYLVERDHEPPHLLHERKDLPAHSAQCGDSVADRDGTGSRAFATHSGAGSVAPLRAAHSTWATGVPLVRQPCTFSRFDRVSASLVSTTRTRTDSSRTCGVAPPQPSIGE